MKMLQAAHENLSTAVAHTVFATARALFAPGAVVHLGAGTGQGPLHGWRQWPVPASLVVDAQPQRMAWAADWAAQGTDRWVSDALVDGADGRAAKMHHASNPDESGLIAPKALQKLWPQLKALEATPTLTSTATRSLDALLCEPAHAALLDAANLWLVVDFFCSPDFWAGASATLAQARVVVLRQAKAAPKGIEPLHDTAERMAALGYALAATLESKHPEVVHAVYLRSLDHALSAAHQQAQAQHEVLEEEKAALLESRDAQAKAQSELQIQLEEESRSKAALAQEIAELRAANQMELRAKDEALSQREMLVQEKAALLTSLDAQAKAHADLQSRFEEESQAKAALAQEKAELLAAHEAQLRALNEVLAQRDQEAHAKEQAQAQCVTLVQESAALLASRDAGVKAQAELQTQLEEESQAKAALAQEITALAARYASISAEKEGQATRVQELLSQRDILVQEKSVLAASRALEMQAKSKAQGERDENARVVSERGREIEKLHTEMDILRADLEGAQLQTQDTENLNQRLNLRQELLQDEMTKAEAQIDLIKDLLLREPRL